MSERLIQTYYMTPTSPLELVVSFLAVVFPKEPLPSTQSTVRSASKKQSQRKTGPTALDQTRRSGCHFASIRKSHRDLLATRNSSWHLFRRRDLFDSKKKKIQVRFFLRRFKKMHQETKTQRKRLNLHLGLSHEDRCRC